MAGVLPFFRMVRVAVLVLLTLAFAGCGTSLRMVHQSNVYFERCHGADYDPTLRSSDRRACWAAWLEHYPEGQPPDRVDYALQRLEAIDQGNGAEPLPGVPSATVGTQYTASFVSTDSVAETETESESETETESETESESETETESETESESGTVAATGVAGGTAIAGPPASRFRRTPPRGGGAVCRSICQGPWDSCITRCADRERGCIRACELEHRACTRGCF